MVSKANVSLIAVAMATALMFTLSLAASAAAPSGKKVSAPMETDQNDEHSFLKMSRLITDDKGQTHWVDIRMPAQALGQNENSTVPRSIKMTSGEIRLFQMPDQYRVNPIHPERRLCAVLTGRLEITASDGEMRAFEAGDVFIATDDVGPAHKGFAAKGPIKILNITLAKNLDLDSWTIARQGN